MSLVRSVHGVKDAELRPERRMELENWRAWGRPHQKGAFEQVNIKEVRAKAVPGQVGVCLVHSSSSKEAICCM